MSGNFPGVNFLGIASNFIKFTEEKEKFAVIFAVTCFRPP